MAMTPMTLQERYIVGWRKPNVAAILATLTQDCVVIESFGPIYRERRLGRAMGIDMVG